MSGTMNDGYPLASDEDRAAVHGLLRGQTFGVELYHVDIFLVSLVVQTISWMQCIPFMAVKHQLVL